MARGVYDNTITKAETDGTLKALSNVQVTVRRVSDNGIATIYQGRVGATQGPVPGSLAVGTNPFTTGAGGSVNFWAEQGEYIVEYHDLNGSPRIPDIAKGWNATPIEWDAVGTIAQRPAAGVAGRRYFAIDEATVYHDTGSAWISDLPATMGAELGVNQGAVVRRGKSIIATEQTRSAASWGLLGTPDRVLGVTVPTDGLLFIAYQALVKKVGGGTGFAAPFLGATQMNRPQADSAPNVLQISFTGSFYGILSSDADGLAVYESSSTNSSLVTTGMSISTGLDTRGGILAAWVAAGTYDVSIQWYNSGGTNVSVKDRKLWVWTKGF